jgi:CSLREA domain-containing protein
MAHILAVFSLSLLLLGLLALPTSALPRSSPPFVIPSYTVNSTADPGDGTCDAAECTLREAILEAAANPVTDTIAFDIPASDPNYGHYTSGVWTIVLATTLDGPSGDIVDGTTQATNYGLDTNPYGPEIEISGESLGPGTTCWWIATSNNII